MVILPIVIVISAVLYIYYKVAILKSKDEVTQLYFNARSRMCLGTFVVFFGITQYTYYQNTLTLFVSIIFIVLGIMQINLGFKESKHYRKEYRRLNPLDQ